MGVYIVQGVVGEQALLEDDAVKNSEPLKLVSMEGCMYVVIPVPAKTRIIDI